MIVIKNHDSHGGDEGAKIVAGKKIEEGRWDGDGRGSTTVQIVHRARTLEKAKTTVQRRIQMY